MLAASAGDGLPKDGVTALHRGFPAQIRPSQYRCEATMSTALRHKMFSERSLMGEFYGAHRPYGPFYVIPYRVVFQGFQPCEVVEQIIKVRNGDSFPRALHVQQCESPHFSVSAVSCQGGKLAPGMFASYRVTFRPEQMCDYRFQIECNSEDDCFIIPVEAIGPRAIMDFPDQISFSSHPVRVRTSRTLSVKNIGHKTAFFSLSVDKPFVVDPCSAAVDVGHSVQVTFGYQPVSVGDHRSSVLLRYDDGHTVLVQLGGSAHEIDVQLSRSSVSLQPTFIGLSSLKTLQLLNGSDWPVSFSWCAQEKEEELSDSQTSRLINIKPDIAPVDVSMVACVSAGVIQGVSSTASARQTAPTLLDPPYEHSAFCLQPQNREVSPKSTAEVTVLFEPSVEGLTESVAYCEVTGRVDRIAVLLSGEGRGSALMFDFPDLDADDVFVGKVLRYPIPLVNGGDIDGCVYAPPDDAAGQLSCSPQQLVVPARNSRVMYVTLTARRAGQLDQLLTFQLAGSTAPLQFRFRARVRVPTMKMDTELLDFGVVPFGFTRQLQCRLTNSSEVDVNCRLSVAGDGDEPALCQLQLHDTDVQLPTTDLQGLRRSCPANPAEFSLCPNKLCLFPHYRVKLELTLVSNTVGEYRRCLEVRAAGCMDVLLSVPVLVQCVAPEVQLLAAETALGRRFKDWPADGTMTLINTSTVPARYHVLPQSVDACDEVSYRCDNPTDIIEPNLSATVPFTVTAHTLGELSVTISVLVLGVSDTLRLLVRLTSRGPVVLVAPLSLNWDVIPVLTDRQKRICITNQAPVTASITAALLSQRCWEIEPEQADLAPDQSVDVVVTACLSDPLQYHNTLSISVQDGRVWEVPLSALGRGSSVQVEPSIGPVLDYGPVFRSTPRSYSFLVTNRGTRLHHMTWSSDGVVSLTASLDTLSDKVSKKSKLGRRPTGFTPAFRISPARMELQPGDTVSMTIEAFSQEVGARREEVSCTAVIGRSTNRNMLYRLVAAAVFVDPSVTLSHSRVDLQYWPIDSTMTTTVDEPQCCSVSETVHVVNRSPLLLTARLSTEHPFYVRCTDGEATTHTRLEIPLQVGTDVAVDVVFTPKRGDMLTAEFSGQLSISYREHAQTAVVGLRGSIVLPNLKLSPVTVEFGDIGASVENCRQVNITNDSRVPAHFEWRFLSDDTVIEWLADESGAVGTPRASADVDAPLLERHDADLGQTADGMSSVQLWKQDYVRNFSINQALQLLPSRGVVAPGDTVTMVVRFHCYVPLRFSAMAVCLVEGGTHQTLQLSATAANPCYHISQRRIDCGQKLYCQNLSTSFVLSDTGAVQLPWSLQLPEEDDAVGQLRVTPTDGLLRPGETQKISITYLPSLPQLFRREIKLKVAYYPAETIAVCGVGVYTAVRLNLPLQYSGVTEEIYQEAVKNVARKLQDQTPVEQICSALEVLDLATESSEQPVVEEAALLEDHRADVSGSVPDTEQGAVDRQQVEVVELVADKQADSPPLSPSWSVISESECRMFDPAVINAEVERLLVLSHLNQLQSQLSVPRCHLLALNKFQYILDFGEVSPGSVLHREVSITNVSQLQAALKIVSSPLRFEKELQVALVSDKLRPGETGNIRVCYRPARFQGPILVINKLFHVEVRCGLSIPIIVRATLTQPLVEFDAGKLDFEQVYVGTCKMCQVRIHNCGVIPVDWSLSVDVAARPAAAAAGAGAAKSPGKDHQQSRGGVDRRRKVTFRLQPSSGQLLPDRWTVINVQFIPIEQRKYSANLVLKVAGSNTRPIKQLRAEGMEARLEFSSNRLQFEPVLPYTDGTLEELTVYNPHPFVVELYSLDFDRQYLHEEHLLRMARLGGGRDVMVLPLRSAGQPLCFELTYHQAELVRRSAPSSSQPDDQASNDRQQQHGIGSSADVHSAPLEDVWSGWSTLARDGATHSLPELEQFLADYVALVSAGGTGDVPLADPVQLAITNVTRDQEPVIEPRRPPVFLVVSAPHTEPELFSVLLAKHYGLMRLSVEQAVNDVLSRDGNAAQKTRDLLTKPPEKAKKSPAAKRKAKKALSTGSVRKSGSSISSPPPVRTESIGIKSVPVSSLAELFAARLADEDCSSGVVLWDLWNCALSADILHTLMAVLAAVGGRGLVCVVTLDKSLKRFRSERTQKSRPKTDTAPCDGASPLRLTDSQLIECDEIEYELLSESDQYRLDRAVQEKRRAERIKKQLQEPARPPVGSKAGKSKSTLINHEESVRHSSRLISGPHQAAHDEEKSVEAQFKAFSDVLPQICHLLSVVDPDHLTPEMYSVEDTLRLDMRSRRRGVQHVIVSSSVDPAVSFSALLHCDVLPGRETVDRELGVGGDGPPLSAAQLFSALSYPPLRAAPEHQLHQQLQPVLPFKIRLDEATSPSLDERPDKSISPNEKSERPASEKPSSGKRSGARSRKGRAIASKSVMEQPSMPSSAEEAQAALSAAIRRALHVDEPAVSAHRWLIGAGQRRSLTLQFEADRCGEYCGSLQLETADTARMLQPYSVNCVGSCVLPDVDRKLNTIFSKMTVVGSRVESAVGVVYVRDTQTLSFGALPLVRPTPASTKRALQSQSSQASLSGTYVELIIKNSGVVAADVAFSIVDSAVFSVSPSKLYVEPGQRSSLLVTAAPTSAQLFSCLLIACIKDNPNPYTVKVSCMGVEPEKNVK